MTNRKNSKVPEVIIKNLRMYQFTQFTALPGMLTSKFPKFRVKIVAVVPVHKKQQTLHAHQWC